MSVIDRVATVPAPASTRAVPFIDLTSTNDELTGEVERAWSQILRRSAFVGGEPVEAFETAWTDYCGCAHAVGVSNGTDALHLTLRALGIGPGDEVIVPTNTFIATAAAVVLAGARPVFVDVDEATLLLTPDAVSAAVTARTSAVIAVHLYGRIGDMDGLAAVASREGIAVIEDAAQAHGAQRYGRRAGTLARAAAFSFYPGKNLGAAGDAGAVTTDDPDLAARIRSLANHGRTTHHTHDAVGTNARLDALQAAFLTAKLSRLDAHNARRARNAARYDAALRDSDAPPLADTDGCVPSHHLYVVRVRERDAVRRALARAGIATAIHYPVPCHRTPAMHRFANGSLPVAEAAAEAVLSLPMYPHLEPTQVDRVCEVLLDAVGGSP